MKRLNPETWAAGVAAIVREFVDRRMAAVDTRTAELSTRQTELDARVGALGTTVAELPVADLTAAVAALDARVGALPPPPSEAFIRAAVDTGLEGPVARLTALEERPIPSPGTIAGLTDGVRQLEERIVRGVAAVDTLAGQVADITAGHDDRLTQLAGAVTELQARPVADPDAIAAVAGQVVGITARMAALPTDYVTLEQVRTTVDDAVAGVVVGTTGLAERTAALEARRVADPDDVRALGAELIALRTTVEAVPDDVRAAVATVTTGPLSAVSELQVRMAAVEARPEPPPPPDITGMAHDLRTALMGELDARMAALPPPVRGDPGPAPTAEQVRAAVDAYLGTWAADFERHAADVLERAAARIPKPADGKDGLGFDDFEVLFDGERTTTFRLARGDQVKEWSFRDARMLERGVFTQGRAYQAGDGVTWGGHFWVAQRDTDEAPVEAGDAWRLVVRRGRDGRGLRGDPGKKGDPGKDGEVRWMRT